MSINSLQPSHAMALFIHKHITSQTIRIHNLASNILNHASFGQSYQLKYNFQMNHTIHVNILYTHILTSTSHHQSSNDLHYTLCLIVIPCPQTTYNQVMKWFIHKHITRQIIRTHNLASTKFQPSISLN